LAVRDALHPTSGQHRQEHFRGLREGPSSKFLRNPLAEMKKNRKRNCDGASPQTGPIN
jgi:hypothetical protein